MGRERAEERGEPRAPGGREVAWRRPESRTILVWTLAVSGLWVFVRLARGVRDGGFDFDERVILAMRGASGDALGPVWLEEAVRDLTSLGAHVNLGLLTLLVCGSMLLQGKRRTALAMLLVVAAGMVLGHLLKETFDRPRPDLVPHSVRVRSASFPSGHALMAAVVYLTLGAMLARMQARAAWRLFCILGATFLTAVVGVTRIYLGVHWPSDVLAGWAVGGLWALFAWHLLRRLQSRGTVEPARDGER